MNILQILPELNVGGVETGVIDLSRALASRGHKSVVVSNGGRLVENLLTSGAKHYQLPVHEKSLAAIIASIPRVCRIIRQEQIDIVHARSRVPAIIGFFAAKATRTPFITTCHGYYKTHWASRVMGWGKKVIVISNAIGRHMIDHFQVPLERIRLIHRGVDLSRFPAEIKEKKSAGRVFTIGMVGRITPLKGHIYFIKALPKIINFIPKVKIVIVGDAPAGKKYYKQQLLDLVKELGIGKYVEFTGQQQDIPRVMSGLDVLVMSTITEEAFGRVLIEAAAAGVSIVATRVGGIVDIVEHNKTGLLVPPQDPAAIARAVVELYRDDKLRHNLSAAARKNVEEKFSLQKMTEATLKVYEEALAIKKILVIKLSSLGDVILSIPSIRALRQACPRAYIAVLVDIRFRDVLQNCPYIDELLIWKKRGRPGDVWEYARFLRQQHFEQVYDLQNNRVSHALAFLSLADERYGYARKWGFLLNHRLKNQKNLPPIKHQFRVLNLAGINANDERLELWPTPLDNERADKILSEGWVAPHQMLVGMHVWASRRWQTKQWPRPAAARLCDLLAKKYSARVVLAGTAEDLSYAQEIGRLTSSNPIIACGKTSVMQLAALAAKCRVFICTDSAVMHIVCAMGVPFVALFGPTDPLRHLPPAKRCVVLQKQMRCRPCYKPQCANIRCMKEISPDDVEKAVEEILR